MINLQKIFIILVCMFLGACASSQVNVRVQSFNDWNTVENFKNQSFNLTSQNSLEQKYYNELLTQYLKAQGLTESNKNPDLLIQANFKTESQSYPYNDPIYRDTGYWRSGGYYRKNNQVYYQHPFWVNTGVQIVDYNRGIETVYAHSLKVNIYKANKKVFESTALINSYQTNMNIYAPYLIESVFKNFPGNNGVIQNYKYELANQKQKSRSIRPNFSIFIGN